MNPNKNMTTKLFIFHIDEDAEKENSNPPSPSRYSLKYCQDIISKISSVNDHHVPKECKEYLIIRESLICMRDSEKHDHAVAFEGMHAGQAVSAMAARERGHLSPCQIQRRFTTKDRKPSDRCVW